jgi:hypothetical protein
LLANDRMIFRAGLLLQGPETHAIRSCTLFAVGTSLRVMVMGVVLPKLVVVLLLTVIVCACAIAGATAAAAKKKRATT